MNDAWLDAVQQALTACDPYLRVKRNRIIQRCYERGFEPPFAAQAYYLCFCEDAKEIGERLKAGLTIDTVVAKWSSF